MKLYEQKGKVVNVFDLKPKHILIKNFKMAEIQKIPFEIRVLRATTNDKNVLKSDEEVKKINITDLNYSRSKFGIIKKYHKLGLHEEQSLKENFPQYIQCINYIQTILSNYYQGVYDKERIVVVKGNGGNLPLLIAGDYVYESEHSKKRTNSNIIHLTEPLYLLHLILKEQYGLIPEKDLETILRLFEFVNKPVKYTIDELKSYDALNLALTENELENYILNKADESEALLRLVRK